VELEHQNHILRQLIEKNLDLELEAKRQDESFRPCLNQLRAFSDKLQNELLGQEKQMTLQEYVSKAQKKTRIIESKKENDELESLFKEFEQWQLPSSQKTKKIEFRIKEPLMPKPPVGVIRRHLGNRRVFVKING
jgi:hypothetical protein